MAYVGNPIDTKNTFQSLQGKRFNGDGSTTDFTLDVAPGSTLDIEVFVGNVRQDPNSAYTLSGTTLSFTGAPPSGTNNIYVVHQAKSVGTIDVPDSSVNSDKLTGNLVTPGTLDVNGQELILDADADTSITADTDDQIDIKIAGADDFKFTANNFNILSGSTLTVDSGATITNSGTANGFGESNIPAFAAIFSGAGSGLANGTYVKLAFDSELYDSGSVYSTSNYRFTPGVAGKYFIHARTLISAASTSPNQGRIAIYKNGSIFNYWRWTNTASISDFSMQISAFDTANTTDYYEAYIYQNNTGGSTSFSINSDPSQTSLFMGYRITSS